MLCRVKAKDGGKGKVGGGDIATWTFKLESARKQQTRGRNEVEHVDAGNRQTGRQEKYSYLSDPELFSQTYRIKYETSFHI